MRSTMFKTALAALLLSAPMSMAYARDHDHHGGDRGDHQASMSRSTDEEDDSGSSKPIYGRVPAACTPWETVWACTHAHR